ncbi:hypothetical protein BH11MYX1_BH11MYX1_14980 [soil metagenome]
MPSEPDDRPSEGASPGAGGSRSAPSRLVRIALGAAVALVVGLACWQHWSVLSASPFPLGVDGYFYPIQVRAILEHGALAYPASPLTFYWMAPFALFSDPIVGAKLGAALGCALVAMPAYGVGKQLGGGPGAGVLAAVLAALSAGAGFLSIEFVKQGIGLTVALVALWAVLGALETTTRRRAIGAAAAVGFAFATHKMAGAIVLVIVAPAVVMRARALLRGRRLIYAVLGGIAIAVTLIILGLAAPHRFVSARDLLLVGDLVTSRANGRGDALAAPGGTIAWQHEALVAGVLAVLAAGVLWTKPLTRELRACGWMIVVLGLVIGSPWLRIDDPQGLGFRLRAAAFVPMALCAAICAGALARILVGLRVPVIVREAILVGGAAVIAIVQLSCDRTEGRVLTHPALAAAVAAANGHLPAGATVIVPERHILYMVDWYTRAPVRLRPESVPFTQRIRMLGLVYIGGPDGVVSATLDAARHDPLVAPPITLHAGHRNGLVLVSEPTWNWVLAQLPRDAHAYFARWPTI